MDSLDAVNNLQGGGFNALKEFQTTTDIKSKSTKEFGIRVARSVTTMVNSAYFADRNARFLINRQIANGKQNMSAFRDLLDMNGKTNYVNLSFKAIMIVSTIISRLVGRWMQNREKLVVTAVDPISTKQKQDEIDEAEFIMNNADMVADIQDATGLPMVKQGQFIPEDQDELDLWATEQQRLPEEILYEKGENKVLEDNGWFDIIKEKCLKDSAEVGLLACEVTTQRDGAIVLEHIMPESTFYSDSSFPDFRDASIKGYSKRYKIIEIREKYPDLPEEEMYKISQMSDQYKTSKLYNMPFDTSWYFSSQRPYDDWGITAMKFYLKTSDSDITRMSVTRNGSLKLDRKQSIPDNKGNNTYVQKDKYNIYCGVYIKDSDILLEWGLQKNMIRPQDVQELGDAECPLCLIMYNNYMMRNLAVPEKIEEPVEQMILARLKIQQLVAKMRPAGNAYDINAMQELDLGEKNVFSPLELKRLSDQTGDFYFSGKDAEGNNIGFPITPMANTEGFQQLQGLVQVYNYHKQVLMDEVGINENAGGETPKARVTNDNYQTSLEVSFNATDYMYNAYLYLMEDAGKKIGCLLHDSVVFGGKKYRKVLNQKDVKDRVFSTRAEMLPTQQQMGYLESMVNNAIQSNPDFIVYCDPFKIKRIAQENVKLAEMYFRNSQKRMRKGLMQQAQQQSEQNAQTQQQSNQMAAQNEAQIEQMKAAVKKQELELEGQNASKTATINMITQIYSKGLPMPPELVPLANAVMQNLILPTVIQTQEQQEQVRQQMMQQQMAAQQQQQQGASQQQLPAPQEQEMQAQ